MYEQEKREWQMFAYKSFEMKKTGAEMLPVFFAESLFYVSAKFMFHAFVVEYWRIALDVFRKISYLKIKNGRIALVGIVWMGGKMIINEQVRYYNNGNKDDYTIEIIKKDNKKGFTYEF